MATFQDFIAFDRYERDCFGPDLSKLARTFLETDYSGFEINGDYRLTERVYLAGAFGSEERTDLEEQKLQTNPTLKDTCF